MSIEAPSKPKTTFMGVMISGFAGAVFFPSAICLPLSDSWGFSLPAFRYNSLWWFLVSSFSYMICKLGTDMQFYTPDTGEQMRRGFSNVEHHTDSCRSQDMTRATFRMSISNRSDDAKILTSIGFNRGVKAVSTAPCYWISVKQLMTDMQQIRWTLGSESSVNFNPMANTAFLPAPIPL